MNRNDLFRRMAAIGQAIADYCEPMGKRVGVHVQTPHCIWVFVLDGERVPDGFVSHLRKLAGASELVKEYRAPDVIWHGRIPMDEEPAVDFHVNIWGVCKIKEYREEVIPAQREMIIPAKPAGVKTVPVYDCGMAAMEIKI